MAVLTALVGSLTGGCARAPRAAGPQPAARSWPPPYMFVGPSPDGRVQLVLGPGGPGPVLLPLGDTLRLRVSAALCPGHSCFGWTHAGRFAWRSAQPAVVVVDSAGLLRPRRLGRAEIRAQRGDTVLLREVLVLPPVARFAWEPRPARAAVGDTLRLRATAYDSTGRVVAVVPWASLRGGEGAAGQFGWSRDSTETVVYADRPGRLTLIARLANRADTLATLIEARPAEKPPAGPPAPPGR